MSKYYITNGNKVISAVGGSTKKAFAPVIGTVNIAARFKYQEGLNFISHDLHGDQTWSLQKFFSSKSGRNYIITTAANYAGDKGTITNQFQNAKSFRSTADAEAYIKNHREMVKSFGDVFIINENLEEHNESSRRTFTDEQLEILGVYKHPTKRVVLSKAARVSIYNKANHYCSLCGKPIEYADMTVDHIVPVSRGGTNDWENMRCVCEDCNRLKGNRLDHEMYTGLVNVCSMKALADPDDELWNRMIRAKVRGTINQLRR